MLPPLDTIFVGLVKDENAFAELLEDFDIEDDDFVLPRCEFAKMFGFCDINDDYFDFRILENTCKPQDFFTNMLEAVPEQARKDTFRPWPLKGIQRSLEYVHKCGVEEINIVVVMGNCHSSKFTLNKTRVIDSTFPFMYCGRYDDTGMPII